MWSQNLTLFDHLVYMRIKENKRSFWVLGKHNNIVLIGKIKREKKNKKLFHNLETDQ